MLYKTVGLYLAVAFSLFSATRAIDCYTCSSSSVSACGEDINENSLKANGFVESGCAACTKSFSALGTVWASIERGCSSAAIDSCDNALGYGFCSCTTTFCNGAVVTSGKMAAVLVLLTYTCTTFLWSFY